MRACSIEDIINETHKGLRGSVCVPVYYKTMFEFRLVPAPQVGWELWDIILDKLWGHSD